MNNTFHLRRSIRVGGLFAALFRLMLVQGASVGGAGAEVFTLAALPDTQNYVKSDALNLGFESQTQWLADNAALSNIVFVTQLGDIVSEGGGSVTEGGDVYPNNEAQWARASRAMATLDAAGVPWNTCVGNHEADQVGDVNSAFTQWKMNFGAITTGRFDAMSGWGGASPDELSTYQFFTGGTRQYMIMHLQFDVPDSAIAWAQGIINSNPGIPTIISTHVYEGTAHGPPNNPYLAGPGRNSQIQIFDKLIKDNDQIFMVLSGHTGQEFQQTKINTAGHEVFQLVQDYAGRANGGDGWMRLFDFDEALGEIRVRTFTPGVPANPTPRLETDANSAFTLPMDWGVRFDGEAPPSGSHTNTFQEGVGAYTGTADTYIESANATVNFGDAAKLLVTSAPSDGLLRFDGIFGTDAGQVPLGSTLASATLSLQTGSALWDGTAPTAGNAVYQLLQAFNETTDTWNNSFGGDGVDSDEVEAASTIADRRTHVIEDNELVTFDVTGIVQNWCDGDPNLGFVIKQVVGENRWLVDSSETGTATRRPLLTVVFTPPVTYTGGTLIYGR